MDKIRRLILFTGFLVLLCFSSIIICLPAEAVLRQHHESPGVLRYHVHNSLQDKQGMTWQVVLFTEKQSDVTKYHLRLVGFPGITQFIHPQPLEIITTNGQVLNAVDLLSISSPAPNVGEFDLTDILPILPEKGSLKLSIILQENHDLSLKISESILIEWQWLLTSNK
ncbi:MAG: DUF3122 domain-containing protein [Xenococcus sp. MO_188.B8]|nr:DUF3122 domain-containing protein [Xenococcus sp. MO_188.B8]